MRSKPDPVDQPERTAHYDCAVCIAEMLHNTIAQTVLLIFPFLQTNITVQMRPSSLNTGNDTGPTYGKFKKNHDEFLTC